MNTALEARIQQDSDVYTLPFPEIPPAMTGADVPLYAAWLKRPYPSPVRAYFNVRVGAPLAHLTRQGTLDEYMTAQFYSPRIDLLLYDGKNYWIVEFHGQATLPQFGRLFAYPHLLRVTYSTDIPLRSLLVAQNINPYIHDLFHTNHIEVILYPDLLGQPQHLFPKGT